MVFCWVPVLAASVTSNALSSRKPNSSSGVLNAMVVLRRFSACATLSAWPLLLVK